jgi:hypothetical protein
VLPPFIYLLSGILQGQKPALVQALMPETSVKSLDQSIVCRLARTDEIKLHSVQICPLIQYLRSEFRAVVYPDRFGQSLFLNYLHQHCHDAMSTESPGYLYRQTLSGIVIH